jgi:hypothetical protein
LEYNCALIKVDWLAARDALRVVGAALVVGVKICTILQPLRKQGPIPEEMFQTLLTHKKQGNLDYVDAPNIIKPTQTRINHGIYTFCIIQSLERLNIFKTGCFPYLGLELITHVIKSQNISTYSKITVLIVRTFKRCQPGF